MSNPQMKSQPKVAHYLSTNKNQEQTDSNQSQNHITSSLKRKKSKTRRWYETKTKQE